MKDSTHSILIIEPYQIVAEGLKHIIQKNPKFEVVATETKAENIIRVAKQLHPKTIIIDPDFPGVDRINLLNEVTKVHLDAQWVVLTSKFPLSQLQNIIKLQVSGCILKSCDSSELLFGIQEVSVGKKYFSSKVTAQFLSSQSNESIDEPSEKYRHKVLTSREKEVLSFIAQGNSNKQIGKILNISYRTVDTHRTNIMKKLGINHVAKLTHYAIKNNLVRE